jgi:dTDP-4-dehydrorhamnose reductase
MSILLLGRTGYIGSAFEKEIDARGIDGVCANRKTFDYTNEELLRDYCKIKRTSVIINAAAYIPTPSVDLCKNNKPETWRANVHLPTMLARVCHELGITFCHISTACLYDDAREYTEDDFPTRLGNGYCGFYLNTKWFAEELVNNLCESHYIWRIRLPFDEFDSHRNYLSKLKAYPRVWDQVNSLTHRGDFVKSALDMVERKVHFGTYNMVNKGSASALWIAERIKGTTNEHRLVPINGPVSGSILSTAKLEATGCGMRPVSEAIAEALKNWVPA